MYAHIKGNVEEIYADRVVIEAAGVGYELVCSKMTLKRLCEGKTAKLFVHFHLSQDSVALYGFFDAEERDNVPKAHKRFANRSEGCTCGAVGADSVGCCACGADR